MPIKEELEEKFKNSTLKLTDRAAYDKAIEQLSSVPNSEVKLKNFLSLDASSLKQKIIRKYKDLPDTFKTNSLIIEFYNKIIQSVGQTISPSTLIETAGKEYFGKMQEVQSITHAGSKGSGVQAGCKLSVKFSSGAEKTFYVKTHQEGEVAQSSGSAKPVDLKELLVYKFLEFSALLHKDLR